MLYWSMAFLVTALATAVYGFGGIKSAATDASQISFFVSLSAFIISLVIGGVRRTRLHHGSR